MTSAPNLYKFQAFGGHSRTERQCKSSLKTVLEEVTWTTLISMVWLTGSQMVTLILSCPPILSHNLNRSMQSLPRPSRNQMKTHRKRWFFSSTMFLSKTSRASSRNFKKLCKTSNPSGLLLFSSTEGLRSSRIINHSTLTS